MTKLKSFVLATVAGIILGTCAYVIWADPTNYHFTGAGIAAIDRSVSSSTEAVIDTLELGLGKFTGQLAVSTVVMPTLTVYDGLQSTMQVRIINNAVLSSAVASGGLAVASNTALSPAVAKNWIDITSNAVLAGSKASNIITITSMSALTGTTVTVNDRNFIEGIHWNILGTSMATTICLSTSLAVYNLVEISSAGVDGLDIINIRAKHIGSHANLFDLTSSSPTAMDIAFSSFVNGYNNASFSINGTTYTQGVDWFKMSLPTETATCISTSVKSAQFTSYIDNEFTTSGSTQVRFEAITPGTAGNAFTLTTSTTAIARNSANFHGGTDQSRAYFEIHHVTYTEGTHWSMLRMASETATSIAAAINRTSATYGIISQAKGEIVFSTPVVVRMSSHGVITYLPYWGSKPNSITITASTGALLSSGTFQGGRDRATLVVGDIAFRIGLEWLHNTSAATSFSSHTAKVLSDALAANTTTYRIIKSSYNYGQQAENSITLSSISAIAGSAITLNGVIYREGIEWNILASSMLTTVCIATTLAAGDATIYITSAGVDGLDVITMKSRTYDSLTYSLVSSTPAAMTAGSATFLYGRYPAVYSTTVYINQQYQYFTTTHAALQLSTAVTVDSSGWAYGYMGGYASEVSTTTSQFFKANTYSPGLAVLYSTTNARRLSGLTNQVTYFVSAPTPNTFYLSDTSSGAVAHATGTIKAVGNYTTSVSTGGGVFILTPLSPSGTANFRWLWSNDNVNWLDVNISSANYVTPYSSSTVMWDFDDMNARYLKMKITPLGAGAMDVNLNITGR